MEMGQGDRETLYLILDETRLTGVVGHTPVPVRFCFAAALLIYRRRTDP